MRADRLLSILLLLQIHKRMTARELAERLEVSGRTIHRDMEALCMAGVPVSAERGMKGGWTLMEGYETKLTGLNEAEIQALFLNLPERLLADLNLDKASAAAMIKLSAALPTVFRHDADYARQRIHIDVTAWSHSQETTPCLHTLQEAVWQERKLSFRYGNSGDCGAGHRLVDPLGLVAKGSVWYLVAAIDSEIRSYRASRIHDAKLMAEPAVRPDGFDLAKFWAESSARFKSHLPKYVATLRVNSAVLPRLPYGGRFARVEQVGEVEDGWAKVRMRFQFEYEACEYVLSFGTNVEILEPVELREKVLGMAKDVIAFYKAGVSPSS